MARVHFPDEQIHQHDSEIVTDAETEDRLNVHLGFLQIHHRYQIKLTVKDKLGEDLFCDPLQNLNIGILEAQPSEDG